MMTELPGWPGNGVLAAVPQPARQDGPARPLDDHEVVDVQAGNVERRDRGPGGDLPAGGCGLRRELLADLRVEAALAPAWFHPLSTNPKASNQTRGRSATQASMPATSNGCGVGVRPPTGR